MFGAFCFGAVLGWYLYYINRYHKAEVQLTDLGVLIGIVGGAAVLTLFPAGTDLFHAYGMGLAFGFFAYFIVLLIMVGKSKNFDIDWFLDGRFTPPSPGDGKVIPDIAGKTIRPMGTGSEAGQRTGDR